MGKKPRHRKRRYPPVVDRGCSKKKAHKTQAEAQVVVDELLRRRVYILGLGAPSTYRCGRCGGYPYDETMRGMRPAH